MTIGLECKCYHEHNYKLILTTLKCDFEVSLEIYAMTVT